MRKLKKSFSIGRTQSGQPKKESQAVLSTRKPFKLSKLNQQILDRLAVQEQQDKQSRLRDRHGNRSNRLSREDPENEGLSPPRFMGESTGFQTSQRVQLELPHNFYPGPGSYDIKRYLADLDQKAAGRRRRSITAKE